MGAQLQGQTVTVQLPENATWIWGAGAVWDKDGGWWSNGRIYYDATTDTYYREEFYDANSDNLAGEVYFATEAQINQVLAKPGVQERVATAKGQLTTKVEDGTFNLDGPEIDTVNDAPYLRLAQERTGLTISPAARGSSTGKGGESLRYPNSSYYEKDSDYVMFEFGRYIPAFLADSNSKKKEADGKASTSQSIPKRYADYNRSASNFKPITDDPSYRPIIMYMPQDLSTEVKTSWNGKAFSNVGAKAIAAANGKFSNINDYNLPEGIKSTFAALFTNAINSVPGVAGNLTLNDVTGSTRGVVLNPNVEVLFDQPDLREFGLKFKMTPHNAEEAKIIRAICRTFTRASLPGFGDTNGASWIGDAGKSKKDKQTSIGAGNMISVPHLCRVSFMQGKSLHPYLTQYKTCALTRVQVNYTPDGNYATYADGAPVATELSLDFLETKLIFRQEISNGTASL